MTGQQGWRNVCLPLSLEFEGCCWRMERRMSFVRFISYMDCPRQCLGEVTLWWRWNSDGCDIPSWRETAQDYHPMPDVLYDIWHWLWLALHMKRGPFNFLPTAKQRTAGKILARQACPLSLLQARKLLLNPVVTYVSVLRVLRENGFPREPDM